MMFTMFDYVDGQPLSLSEIEMDLPGHSAELLLESKWTFITQEVNNLLKSFSFSLNVCVLTIFCFLINLHEYCRNTHI
jgi:ubiquitin-like-conjugating enzyme ATG10